MIIYLHDSYSPIINIPVNTTLLRLGEFYNYAIDPGIIPNSVTHLYFGWKFNQEINPGVIPTSVIYLSFSDCFNKSINPGSIPGNVIKLIFGEKFNQEIKPGSIPISVKYLVFGDNFNQEIKPSTIPNNLIHLVFGRNFYQDIEPDVIPACLQRLYFLGNQYPSLININFETEINLYNNKNKKLPDDRIINLFEYVVGYEDDISIDVEIYMDEYNIGEHSIDSINIDPIIKLSLIPKKMTQRKIKSANYIHTP